MANIFGKNYTKNDLLRLTGDLSQIGGIRPVEYRDGNERGVRALQFKSGSGLEFTILPDRAMDVFEAKFNGKSLCWHSQAGPVNPAFYDRHDIGWLWSHFGGLITTCGLTQVGPPHTDDDDEVGLHGRVSNIPAKSVSFGSDWEGDELMLWASGEIRQARLFGENLLLRRTVQSKLGASRFIISDEVENQGHEPTPHMFLYHCNIGFPIVDEGAELLAVVNEVEPRDEIAEPGVDNFDKFEAPIPHYEEQVFFIDHDTDEKENVRVALVNREFMNGQGIGVYMRYSKKELPYYTEWKMVGEGAYVVSMEPGNCVPEGRKSARDRGVLKMLEPGDKVTYHIEIGVLASNQEIREFEAKLRGMDA